MSDEQKRWAREVDDLVRAAPNNNFRNPIIIDVGVGCELGFAPAEVAAAIVGRNPKVFEAIVARMREVESLSAAPQTL